MTDLHIVAINRTDRLALASDDRLCEITNMFDAEGEETDDVEDATAAVVRYADDKWFTITLADYDGATN